MSKEELEILFEEIYKKSMEFAVEEDDRRMKRIFDIIINLCVNLSNKRIMNKDEIMGIFKEQKESEEE